MATDRRELGRAPQAQDQPPGTPAFWARSAEEVLAPAHPAAGADPHRRHGPFHGAGAPSPSASRPALRGMPRGHRLPARAPTPRHTVTECTSGISETAV